MRSDDIRRAANVRLVEDLARATRRALALSAALKTVALVLAGEPEGSAGHRACLYATAALAGSPDVPPIGAEAHRREP